MSFSPITLAISKATAMWVKILFTSQLIYITEISNWYCKFITVEFSLINMNPAHTENIPCYIWFLCNSKLSGREFGIGCWIQLSTWIVFISLSIKTVLFYSSSIRTPTRCEQKTRKILLVLEQWLWKEFSTKNFSKVLCESTNTHKRNQ